MVDGVPTYVVRNDNNGNESVFHHTRLLLWIAADADGDDGMRSSPTIAALDVNGPTEGDMTVECVVSQDMSYGLSLAMLRTMIGPPATRQDIKPEHNGQGWCCKELAM